MNALVNDPPQWNLASLTLATLCENDIPAACTQLGALHQGRFLATSSEFKAAVLYEQACALDYGPACFARGRVAHRTNQPDTARWYQRACDLKEPLACGQLVAMRGHKEGDSPDLKTLRDQAESMAATQCAQGKATGCLFMGLSQAHGRWRPTQEFDAAEANFARGCELDHGDSCAQLGRLLAQNPERDETEIKRLFQRSCALNSGYGCSLLATFVGFRGEERQALKFAKRACDLGNGRGCHQVGAIHGSDNFTKPDKRASQRLTNARANCTSWVVATV